MQIIEKPVQKEDWSQDVSCPQCLAKLSVSADDVSFIEAHTRHWGLESQQHVDDSYAVECAVCKKSITVSPEPIWSVQEFVKKKLQDEKNRLEKKRQDRAIEKDKNQAYKSRLINTWFAAFLVVLWGAVMFCKSMIDNGYNPFMPW